MQADDSIQERRPSLVFICMKQRTCRLVNYDVPADQSERRKARQTLGPCQRNERVVEHEGDYCHRGPLKKAPRTWKKVSKNERLKEEMKPFRPQQY